MSPPMLLPTLAAQFLAALALYPAMLWTGGQRRAAFTVSVVIVMIAPAIIDGGHRWARLVAALWASWLVSKLLDLFAGVRPSERMSLTDWFMYIINPLWMVYRQPPSSPVRRDDARRLLWRGASAAL